MKQNLLGYSVNVRRVEACADEIMSEVTKGADGGAAHVAWLACLNPHSYAVALEDQAFWRPCAVPTG
jgi:hypothetical protein